MKTRKRNLLAVPARLEIVLLLLVAALGLTPVPVTHAATFDIADGDVAALIAAINTANGNGQPDTINLAAGGTYTLTAVNNDTHGPNGLPSILADSGNSLTINGNGATIERSSAGGTPDFRIFHVGNNGDLTLNDLTIADGDAGTRHGGGIYNYDWGDVTLNNCTVSGNKAGNDGGGIRSWDDMTLTNCTISGNEAGNDGGGIYNDEYARLTLTNCTVSGNTADADNDGDGDGGGIYRLSGTVNLKNTILAGNTDPTSAPDCSGTLISQDYNLVGDNSGCTFTEQTHDQVGTGASSIDPNLGPLANNGGDTQTHALLTGSPAIDAIPEGGTGYNGVPATDQRGVSRPQPAGGDCDIGAYEAEPEPEPVGGTTEPASPLALLWP